MPSSDSEMSNDHNSQSFSGLTNDIGVDAINITVLPKVDNQKHAPSWTHNCWGYLTGNYGLQFMQEIEAEEAQPFLHISVNCVRCWKCGMGCGSCMETLRPQWPCRRQGRFKQKGEELEGRAEYFNTVFIGIYFCCLITSYFQHFFPNLQMVLQDM
jgi:hypothetical protein